MKRHNRSIYFNKRQYYKRCNASDYKILIAVLKDRFIELYNLHKAGHFNMEILFSESITLPNCWANIELQSTSIQLLTSLCFIMYLKHKVWKTLSYEYKYALIHHELLHISYKYVQQHDQYLYGLAEHDMPEINEFKEIVDKYGEKWGESMYKSGIRGK